MKHCEVDKNLTRQIDNHILYVCKKHFEAKFIVNCKYTMYILDHSISNTTLSCKTSQILVKCDDHSMNNCLTQYVI